MISRIFSCKFLHIQIASVSGHSIHFIFKTCQIVAGTSMIRQFHEFFNLIFGGFLTFGTTVYCLLRSNNTKWNQKWKTDNFSFLKNEFVTLSFIQCQENEIESSTNSQIFCCPTKHYQAQGVQMDGIQISYDGNYG